MSCRASSSPSEELLKLIPPQRIAGLVRVPSFSVSSMISSTLGRANASSPSSRSRAGSWHTTNTSGWLPWSNDNVTPAKAGWSSEPCPSMTSQCVSGADGLSISAAPAAKSATTASIGMPRPAMMIPVWPVARKSASMPR